MKSLLCCLLFVFALPTQPLRADEEASNTPHVAASTGGRCYAKSVPVSEESAGVTGYHPYGSVGLTRIYEVTATEQDALVHTLPMYAAQLYLECNVTGPDKTNGIAVVMMGPWARGRHANADDLAVAFYFQGKLVRRYSTLDITGSPDRVSNSVSHYTVFQSVDGFRFSNSGVTFEAKTHDGRSLVFDPATGAILTASPSGKDNTR